MEYDVPAFNNITSPAPGQAPDNVVPSTGLNITDFIPIIVVGVVVAIIVFAIVIAVLVYQSKKAKKLEDRFCERDDYYNRDYKDSYTYEERRLINNYRQLSSAEQQVIDDTINAFLETSTKKKKP